MRLPTLKNAPISQKLTLLAQAAVTVALTLSCVAFVANHLCYIRGAMAQQLTALTEVLGANTSAALIFDDSDTATQVLSSLRQQPSVLSACVYDAQGRPFASYNATGAPAVSVPAPKEFGAEFTRAGFLTVSQEIVGDDQVIGIIRLTAGLDTVRSESLRYAGIVALVMLVAFGAAHFLASRLQRAISKPILELTRTAERISAEENYSIRVTPTSTDELGVLYKQFNHMLEHVESGERELQEAQNKLEMRVAERTRQLSEANRDLSVEVNERRKAERELERVHNEFLEAARHAGMAEIASGVLHNVGNVLNSVNVSTTMVTDRLKSSKSSQLGRVAEMFDEHRDNLDEFLTQDAKGKQVPEFLRLLAENLQDENVALISEVSSLASNIDHIKAIIATQQSYASTSGLVEPIDINELLDDAVKLNSSSFERHMIRVSRDLADLPLVLVDKQRLLQIVINLVKNAKEALVGQGEQERVLGLHTRQEGDRLVIEVSDTGVGIKRDSLAKVFSHGFTTKAGGHGFGLHSCANAATEMDGEIRALSDGPMQGATLRLTLPYTPAMTPA